MLVSSVIENINEESEIDQTICFSTTKEILVKALGHLQNIVEKKNTIAILSNVKFSAKNGVLQLTATDMEITACETISAQIFEDIEFTAQASMIYEIIRKLPNNEDISFYFNKNSENLASSKIVVKSTNCKFTLSTLPVKEYPVIGMEDVNCQFTLSSAELVTMMDKVKISISEEDARFYLAGVFLYIKEEEGGKYLCATSTDGHRLSSIKVDVPEGAENLEGIIIPKKTVYEVKKIIEDFDNDVKVSISETKISFECANIILISKLIDGEIPSFSFNPAENSPKYKMKISRDELIKAVDRVSTLSSDKTRSIRFKLSTDNLKIYTFNEDANSAFESLNVEYENIEVDLGFNAKYVLDVASVLEGDFVEFIFSTDSEPTIIRDAALPGALYILMPMRM